MRTVAIPASEPSADPSVMLAALRANDRDAALRAALDAYFGPPLFPAPRRVPAPLATLFTRFEGGPLLQNQLTLPDQRGVFYVENQSCNEWALADESADPLVFRDNEVIEREPLSGFVLQVALFEASMGALPAYASGWMDDETCERLVSLLTEVPLAPWSWPVDPTRFYVADGIVAHTQRTDRETWIFLSALSARQLEPFSRIDGVEWTSFGDADVYDPR
jgi:hypothetical protein